MADLTSLGFKRDVISEAIVSTLNPDGSANAAPMGLKLLSEQHLSMSIFNTSIICQNLKTRKAAVVNLTGDIEVFYRSAFKEANPDGVVPAEWFVNADAVEALKLRVADATVEVSVSSAAPDSDKTLFTCKVERISVEPKLPQVYCRAMPLTLEAITHATRVKAFAKNPDKQEEVAKLIRTIQDCAAIVGRVAPNSQYTAVLADLQKRIDGWRT
jgi:Uncharacterized conserved protein